MSTRMLKITLLCGSGLGLGGCKLITCEDWSAAVKGYGCPVEGVDDTASPRDCEDEGPELVGGLALAEVAALTVTGGGEDLSVGDALAPGGDRGDGVGRALVAAPWAVPGGSGGAVGKVCYVEAPAVGGKAVALADLRDCWIGEGSGEAYAGALPTGPADLDGDGLDDLVVGAPAYDVDADGALNQHGAAYVVLDPLSRRGELSDADMRVYGVAPSGFLGGAVQGVALDLGGSVVPTLVIAQVGYEGVAEGGVLLFPFSADALDADDAAGALSFPGAINDVEEPALARVDLGSDGLDEIVLAAPRQGCDGAEDGAGVTSVLDGASFGEATLEDAALLALCGEDGDLSGHAVAGGGDLDGDGAEDLLVGAPQHNGTDGVAFVVSELSALMGQAVSLTNVGYEVRGSDAGGFAAYAVSMPGDLDCDGRDDLLVGQPDVDESAGAAWIVYGPIQTTIDLDLENERDASLARLAGEEAGDNAGWAVSGAGDVDNDGRADLLVGAYNAQVDGTLSSGKAYLITGE